MLECRQCESFHTHDCALATHPLPQYHHLLLNTQPNRRWFYLRHQVIQTSLRWGGMEETPQAATLFRLGLPAQAHQV